MEVNGSGVSFSPPAMIQAGRVFVPLRGVFERLGASVVYANGTINATGNGRNISLQIGSTQATVNGQPQAIDVAPFIVGASTYVPLRFVSEALGAQVNWDDSNRVVSIALAGAPPANAGYAPAQYGSYVSLAPPPIPVYEQPYVPAPNDIWQPGYWAWGPYGYYWVPGTWVEPPQPGYLWTPGYWSSNNGGYAWNQGYWAVSVGFYGGVNYGAGYYGNGYDGGQWSGNNFRYNTFVTRVDTATVQNVYTDRTVYVDNSTTRPSYNGGAHGIAVRPSAQQLIVAKATHLGLTAAQQQHAQTAAQDRRQLATVNHNAPPVLSVAHPLSASNPPAGLVPVTASDRAKAAPVVHAPAPVVHTAAPVVHAPAPFVHTAVPIAHLATPAARTAAPSHPAMRTMPVVRAPAGAATPMRAPPKVRPIVRATLHPQPPQSPEPK